MASNCVAWLSRSRSRVCVTRQDVDRSLNSSQTDVDENEFSSVFLSPDLILFNTSTHRRRTRIHVLSARRVGEGVFFNFFCFQRNTPLCASAVGKTLTSGMPLPLHQFQVSQNFEINTGVVTFFDSGKLLIISFLRPHRVSGLI